MAALRSKPFRRYLWGFGGSLVADGLWFTSLGWASGQLGNTTQTSIVMAAGTIPRAVLLLLGGAIADRHGALRTVLTTQWARVAVLTGFALWVLTAGMGVWMLVGFAMVFGVLDAFHMPAGAALPPALLPPAQLPAGQGVVQTLERLALVAAAPVGGLMIAFSGAGGTVVLAAAVLALALPFLVSLRRDVSTSSPKPDRAESDLTLFGEIRGALVFAADTRCWRGYSWS